MNFLDKSANLNTILQLGYICVPRFVLYGAFHGELYPRQFFTVYLFLLTNAYFAPGSEKIRGRVISCNRGECVFSFREIARLTGIRYPMIGFIIKEMNKKKYIESTDIQVATFFRIFHYDEIISGKKSTKHDESSSDNSLQASSAPSKVTPKKALSFDDMVNDFYGFNNK